jgi:hypothetical protein
VVVEEQRGAGVESGDSVHLVGGELEVSAEPGTRSAEALELLASWVATPEPVPAPGDPPLS